MIKIPVDKTKDELAIEITENKSIIAEPVKITCLGSSSEKAGSKSNSNDGEFCERKGRATKTELLGSQERAIIMSPFGGTVDKRRLSK
jgi:hypothetical protein